MGYGFERNNVLAGFKPGLFKTITTFKSFWVTMECFW